MTTLRHPPAQVHIAGVPWPTYKLIALLVGAVLLVLVAVVTGSTTAAVLTAAGSATIVWLTLGVLRR